MKRNDATHTMVKKAYAAVAERQSSCCGGKPVSCCDKSCDVPDHPVPEAELGLSCGNPVAFSHLKEGDVVLDLGSGAGRDVFLAAQKVGSKGKAIGVDMTPEMLRLARRNAGEVPEGDRPRQRGVPQRAHREAARRRRDGGRGDLQLRHQPLDGQAAGLPRGAPRAEARRADDRLGHRPRARAAGEAEGGRAASTPPASPARCCGATTWPRSARPASRPWRSSPTSGARRPTSAATRSPPTSPPNSKTRRRPSPSWR